MTIKLKIEYTADEKQRIVEALRATAVAQAELWDVLLEVENEHACSIEIDDKLISSLSGDCSHPPSFEDLKSDAVWEAFEEHSELSA